MDNSGANPGFWKGVVPTLDDFEIGRHSRRGNAEGVAGGQCERGLNPLTGGSGGLPQNMFKI